MISKVEVFPVQMLGLLAVFGPGTGETKKAVIMVFLKNAIGVGEHALGSDIVDEAEFVAGVPANNPVQAANIELIEPS